ncbi:LPXTG cell wall anchor domain-containing protein [Streptomyces sp. PKU-MA01144]|uniref:LPXTG cell wall anchor domain-containing protein n=1 Tax=Streptomyces sp. PKU-MA01144 TaxID=2729138 RepID=UPI00147DBA8F|nr:LPXTG cell wall anchor domain-containing protein [Streptomyces sp. PKU-MA01144]NNJ07232.1 LPXTG cell wall anchor domain-containing protein [Streptomyces sp. PKU-MA01144]
MPRRSVRRLVVAAAAASLVAAAPLIAAQPAFAQYPPAPNLTIQDDDLVLEPGQVVDFIGRGFEAGEPVTGRLAPVGGAGAAGALGRSAAVVPPAFTAADPDSRPTPTGSKSPMAGDDDRPVVELGRWTADANGIVDSTVTIPEGTREGAYYFQLAGENSDLVLSARVTIDEDGDGDGDDDDHGDGDHGRPGHGDDDHGRPGHDDDRGHHGGHDRDGRDHDDDDDDDDNGGKSDHDDSSDDGKEKLADTGSSDGTVALLTATGGLLLLGGGALVVAKRRRNASQRG